MKTLIKYLLWIAIAVAVVVVFKRAFESTPVPVDVATISAGPLLVTLDDDGFTRVRERYTFFAPADGRLKRPALKAGAQVQQGETVLFEFEPLAPRPLDARSRAEAEARVQRAIVAGQAADARISKAEAQLTFANATLKRRETLEARGLEAQQDFDRAKRDERIAAEDLNAARFDAQVAHLEIQIARVALLEESELGDKSVIALAVTAPMTGHVTRIFEASARTVSAGTPILEVGDISALELVADFLSQDAVKVEPGMQVLIEGWGGELVDGRETTLLGRVRHVEPSGFTKISALGVEEQRINILVDPDGSEDGWPALGDGYRAELRIVIWESDKVLIVPTGALFREDGSWRVFVVQEGETHLRTVKLGHRNGLQAEVLDGLSPGEQVVLYPSELVTAGTQVDTRQ